MTPKPLLLLGLISWSVLVLFTPATVHLRDSGEFLLTAFALDIPHPAGFPTYAQLANLFALLPLGPIAWRINAFSTVMIFFCAVLSWYLSFRLLTQSAKLRESLAAILALIAPVIFLGSNAALHQAYAAEVYGLNTVILLALLLCYERWLRSDDKRFLYLASFLAALGLGNHVSLAASIVLMLPLVVIDRRKIGIAIPISILFGLIGLAVYAYLPIRAAVPRPLMVATPDTFERFIAHITDERDRELRPEALPFASNVSIFEQLGNDLGRISSEVGVAAILLGAIGLYLLFPAERRLAWGLLSVLLGNWLFFLGWDPDPWLPTFVVLAVLSSVAAGYLVERLARSQEQALLPNALVLLTLALSLFSFSQLSVGELREVRDNSFVRDQAKRLIATSASSETLVIEPSWFIVRYLQQIEKFRDDLTVVYLPTIMFPKFFSPLRLELNGSITVSTEGDYSGSPDERMSRFISIASRAGSIIVEPVAAINRLISEVARFSAEGSVELLRGKVRELESGYANSAILQIAELHKAAQSTPSQLRADSQQYVETLATTRAELLKQVGEKSLAGDLLLASCGSINDPQCSGTMLNNLAAHYIGLGEYARAITAADAGLKRPGAPFQALSQNISIAQAAARK